MRAAEPIGVSELRRSTSSSTTGRRRHLGPSRLTFEGNPRSSGGGASRPIGPFWRGSRSGMRSTGASAGCVTSRRS